jgi:hypothetical protein
MLHGEEMLYGKDRPSKLLVNFVENIECTMMWRLATSLVDDQTSWPCTLVPLYTVDSPCI